MISNYIHKDVLFTFILPIRFFTVIIIIIIIIIISFFKFEILFVLLIQI